MDTYVHINRVTFNKLIAQVNNLEAANQIMRNALEEIKDADKVNFSAQGVSLAVRIATKALERTKE